MEKKKVNKDMTAVDRLPRRRRYVMRAPRVNQAMNDAGYAMLDYAEKIYKHAQGLDTGVRDSVSTGLAAIVTAAYDSLAIGQAVPNDSRESFIASSTAKWFREKGFMEWFCIGASSEYRTSLPRSQGWFPASDPPIVVTVRSKRKNKAKK